MKESVLRFLIGGIVVSGFAALGDTFKPKSFAGLFGAAPSVALATLGLTILTDGKPYAAMEARSMLAGACAFFIYACASSWMLMHTRFSAFTVTASLLVLWFAGAFGIWQVLLR